MASRKFKYVGDPNEDDPRIPDKYEFLGLTFKKGRARAVEDDRIAGKCAGNNHFAEVGESNGEEPDLDALKVRAEELGLNPAKNWGVKAYVKNIALAEAAEE